MDWQIVGAAILIFSCALALVAFAAVWALYKEAEHARGRAARAAEALLDAAEATPGGIVVDGAAWGEYTAEIWGRERLPRRSPGKWRGKNRIAGYIRDDVN